VGANYHGFMTGFESRGVDGCEEQWYAMDTRVDTGSDLCEDKNHTSYVRQTIMMLG
jgi:hypothetical protein